MNWRDAFVDIATSSRDLAPLTTWKVGGRARDFFEPRDPSETVALLHDLECEGLRHRVIGGGANVLIEDGDHVVPYIHPVAFDDVLIEGERVSVGAGVPFPRLVADMSRAGLAGLESLAGIPGRTGGICAMNAGGRWGEIRDVVESIDVATPNGVVTVAAADAGFGYRTSMLPTGVITRVVLRLERVEASAPLVARMKEILKAKSESQPLKLANGGCVFRNPKGDHAGRLIERLGLKGRRAGAAEISPRHGNFIVNHGGASFRDVLSLIEMIEQRAREDAGIELVREIKIWAAGEGPAAAVPGEA